MSENFIEKTSETIKNMPERDREEARKRQMDVIEEGHGEEDQTHDYSK